LRRQLETLLAAARDNDYDVLVFGDYAIARCERAVYPNRALAAANLLRTRDVAGMTYADLWASPAFALVDHEVAHVYTQGQSETAAAAEVLRSLAGVAEVLDRDAQHARGVDHPNSGELVVIAEQGAWLSYPWWTDRSRAPDFATHVDIHNKPGFDPCELRMAWWPPLSVRQDAGAVAGSHGRTGDGREIVWACTCPLPGPVDDVIDLAESVRRATGDWWL
jgi:predicted AlkP superfamily pyrophosphatase or phosphodiesterase